jgi:heme A synthase
MSSTRTLPREKSVMAQPSPAPETRHRRFAFFASGVFVYSLLAILWGYFLRISESGDGCGTDWPLCHGAVVPEAAHFSTFVEFTHRLSSGVVLLLVAAMAVWAFRAFPRGAAVRRGAGASLLLTLSESLFGAVLVVFGWVAGDVSTGRILIRPLHVTNTFLLMAALALTAWWALRGTPRVPPLRAAGVRLLLPAFLGTLALAWTGAWTGLAATAFPATTLQEGMGQYLAPEHLLVPLRMLHPVLAVGVVILLVRLALRVRERHAASTPRRLAVAVGGLALVQLVVGPVTILLGNPVAARLGHLLLADLLWVALILLGSTVLEEEPSRSPADPWPAGVQGAGALSP